MSSPTQQLDDALGLVEMLCQLTAQLAARGNGTDYLVRGMSLTLQNVSGLLLEAKNAAAKAEPQPRFNPKAGRPQQQPAAESGPPAKAFRIGENAPGHVRELNPHSQATGTFQRVVLPKEPPSGNDPLEH